MKTSRKLLVRSRLLVVKLGTGVLSNAKGGLDSRRIAHLAAQVAQLRRLRRRVVIVTSGAIGAGMDQLGINRRPSRIVDLQTCAAIGQSILMACYDRAFARHKLTVAQILLTHDDFARSERRKNARQTILSLLNRGAVPVINENDAVSFAEIKFGDNDQLAAMVHELIGSQACVILSNVDGFLLHFSSPPAGRIANVQIQKSPALPTISKITAEIIKRAGDSVSRRSVGGMRSKLLAARRVLATRRPMVIANGHIPNILLRLVRGEPLGTIFLP